jgi:hypothetical protein
MVEELLCHTSHMCQAHKVTPGKGTSNSSRNEWTVLEGIIPNSISRSFG